MAISGLTGTKPGHMCFQDFLRTYIKVGLSPSKKSCVVASLKAL